MNCLQAKREGLEFAGFFDSKNKNKVQKEIDKFKKRHPKARLELVSEKEGHIAYGDSIFFVCRDLDFHKTVIKRHEVNKLYIKRKHDMLLKDELDRYNNSLKMIDKYRTIIENSK
jgi:hypothetical protein